MGIAKTIAGKSLNEIECPPGNDVPGQNLLHVHKLCWRDSLRHEYVQKVVTGAGAATDVNASEGKSANTQNR